MKKLTLDMDALVVESFETDGARQATGTIRGAQMQSDPSYCALPTCGETKCEGCPETSWGTCADPTCAISCYGTCSTCAGMATCAVSCGCAGGGGTYHEACPWPGDSGETCDRCATLTT